MEPTYPVTHDLPVTDDAPWLDCMDGLRQASAAVSGVEVLSPAAKAILDAGSTALWSSHGINAEGKCAAAVLRAAALYCKRDRLQLLALADELDASDSLVRR